MQGKPQTNLSQDREIRVFISSTFRDMQAERDILIKKIFMQLRKLYEDNLAGLFQATNRLAEAQPLMQRALEIFAACPGGGDPNSRTVADNYASLLRAMGRSPGQIRNILEEIGRRFGIDLGG